jgi:hypothetical protein
MFYARINKLKIFNNREGFIGLFNRAEIRIYSYVYNPTGMAGHFLEQGAKFRAKPLTVADMLDLDEDKRTEKLLDAVMESVDDFAQSQNLAIDNVKDNQTLTFDDAGLALYQSNHVPDSLNIQLWVIESDSDVRKLAIDAETVLDSAAFKGLLAAVGAAMTVTNPILTAAIGVGGVVVSLLHRKLRANKDDLVGYWQAMLNREEHYPHGVRDRQDVSDSTGNIRIDYTLFGFEKSIFEESNN